MKTISSNKLPFQYHPQIQLGPDLVTEPLHQQLVISKGQPCSTIWLLFIGHPLTIQLQADPAYIDTILAQVNTIAEISIHYHNTLERFSQPLKQILQEGEHIELKCRVECGDDPVDERTTLTWYFNDEVLVESDNVMLEFDGTWAKLFIGK